jgi:hypothetical protein
VSGDNRHGALLKQLVTFNKEINMQRFKNLIAPAAVFLASLISTGNALANDRDLWATTVPASACQPRNETDAGKLLLSNGAWVFTGSETGSIVLYCPLPLNAFTLTDFSNDNDITRYRIYYRDTDGGTAGGNGGLAIPQQAYISTRLVYRRSDGLYSAGNLWHSNVTPINAVANTTAIMNNVHDVQFDALYSFYVVMYRANTSMSPAFSGIDFPSPPPVP